LPASSRSPASFSSASADVATPMLTVIGSRLSPLGPHWRRLAVAEAGSVGWFGHGSASGN
jgi:hypothetical protein